MPDLAALNRLDAPRVREAFLKCCHSSLWADRMVAARPFQSDSELFGTADAIWRDLGAQDYLEAFAGHPRIGDIDSLRQKFAATASWAAGEQAGAAAADDATLQGLADGNRKYEARFGHIFIVCATGKTASEMLDLLRARLDNDADTELQVAAGEQAKITRIRLEKLLSE